MRRAGRALSALVGALLASAALGAAAAPAAPQLEVSIANDSMNEIQEVFVVNGASGQFRLRFGNGGPGVAETADLPVDITGPQMEAALNALDNINEGGGSVSVLGYVNNDPEDADEYLVFFDGGPLAGADVPQMVPVSGTTPLSGTSQRVLVQTSNRVGISRSDQRLDYNVKVTNTGPDPTSGPVTVEVELPDGTFAGQLFARDTQSVPMLPPRSGLNMPPPVGWSCTTQKAAGGEPSKATCTRSNSLAAGASYPEIGIVAGLGADAPVAASATATVSGGGSAPGSAVDAFTFLPTIPFEIEALTTKRPAEGGGDSTQAGGHPHSGDAFFSVPIARKFFGLRGPRGPVQSPRTVVTDLPRGLVGNALAIPDNDGDGKPDLCPGLEQVKAGTCPPASIVGGVAPKARDVGALPYLAVYSIEPEFGVPAQFAFFVREAGEATFTFAPRLRAEDNYAITIESAPSPAQPALESVDVVLCNSGANTAFVPGWATVLNSCKPATDPTANKTPLFTNPTRCVPPLPEFKLGIDTYENPLKYAEMVAFDPLPTGCENVKFEPEIDLQPTSAQAGSPTGLDVELTMPTDGLESPTGIAQAMMKRVKVHFPEGMSVNASAGHGLGSCSSDQVGMSPDTGVPNDAEARCPDSSKIGTIAVDTPVIQETLTGDVFIAKQGDHPFETPIALYMVFSSKKDGVTVKVAGKVETHPVTGQMTVTFDNNPEWPFSKVELRFPQGSRANLTNPPRCGTYEIKAEITPWSALDPDNPTASETVTSYSPYNVSSGPGGGPCPSGALQAGFSAGSTNPVAGQPSPFVMRLTREDGSDRFKALDVSPPLGMTAHLRGVPYCPDAALASIPGAVETGQAQIDSPSCPAASLVGRALAGAGAGPNPLFVDTGRVYLAGPYKGAPLSLAVVTPAVAGPLDLGNVVIRTALHINPETAQITAVSDPIPHILHGILLNVREIRVAIDRPGFALNPTSCAEKAVGARVGGLSGASIDLADRFQVGNCAALGFKPRVNLRLVGGTKRGGHPSLRAVVRPRPGDANIRRAAVALPRSAFLDQANIRTICTRVQWAADNCPKAARYGFATAWSPLLDQPLKGPVYLRSSDNLLPDLVADLRGPAHQPIRIEAAFRTDSIRGGIRSTIDFAPDAPVSRFVLRMQGGKRKGLIVNSRDICRGTHRANSRMTAHNNRRSNTRPKVHAANCGKARKGAKGRGGKRSNLSQLKAVR